MPLEESVFQTPKTHRNAKKPGIYARTLNKRGRMDFELVSAVSGVDEEIALLRFNIKSVMARDPDNVRLIRQLTDSLARLLKARYEIHGGQENQLKEAFTTVIRDIGLPMGLGSIIGQNKQ